MTSQENKGLAFSKQNTKIVFSPYENFTNQDGFAEVVTTQDILDKDSSLSIPLYVNAVLPSEEELKTFSEVWDSYIETNKVFQNQMKEAQKVLNRIGKEENKNG